MLNPQLHSIITYEVTDAPNDDDEAVEEIIAAISAAALSIGDSANCFEIQSEPVYL